MTEREALAVLASAQDVAYERLEAGLHAAGSALALFEEPERFARQLTPKGAAAVKQACRRAQELLDACRAEGLALLTPEDEGYPPLLRHIAKPPRLLFVEGRADLRDAQPVAIVGTRRASIYGIRHTHEIAGELAAAGCCIVSGLALGIDAAAHEGALHRGGRTVAVLGGAHDRFFPQENEQLRERILAGGGSVVSEYPPERAPDKTSFLWRNRIIAGMSRGVLVTDGPWRSGALNTAHHAVDEGREVFALPGDVESAGSSLPHRLIAEGARLTTGAQDILRALDIAAPERDKKPKVERKKPPRAARPEPPAEKPEAPRQPEEPEGMTDDERAVLRALDAGEADFDALAERTGIDSDALGALLTMMELDGWIETLPGLRYRRA